MHDSSAPAVDLVLAEERGPVALLRLNRPDRLNAWGRDMGAALARELDRIAADDTVRCCLLTGAGDRSFSSGADLGDATTHARSLSGSIEEVDLAGHPTFARLLGYPKPIVCAVNGYAIGAGFLVALCSDVIVAATSAQFALPQVKLGILPAYGGLARLAQWVGRGRALEIGLRGRRVGADEALRIGLVTEVHDDAALEAAAVELATELAGLPPLSIKLAKESLAVGLELGAGRAAGLTDQYRSAVLQQTEDSEEAHAAWREKRQPRFVGR